MPKNNLKHKSRLLAVATDQHLYKVETSRVTQRNYKNRYFF